MTTRELKLRATISIDVQAHDFIEAGAHQQQLGELLATIRKSFPSATLDIRQSRSRPVGAGSTGQDAVPKSSNRVIPYRRSHG